MTKGDDTEVIELQVNDEKLKTAEDFCFDNPAIEGEDGDHDPQADDEDEGEAADVAFESSANVIEEADRMQYGIPLTRETRRRKHKYGNALKTLKPFRGNKNKEEIPVDKAGFFSYITYSWLTPLMTKARTEPLEMRNIWKMPKIESASANVDRLEELWEDELKTKGPERASFQSAWLRFIRTRLIVACFVLLLSTLSQVVSSAYVVETILDHIETQKGNRDLWVGLVLAAAMLVAEVFRAVFFATTWMVMYQTAIRLRGAVVTLVYRHLVRVKSLGKTSMGELINISVNDSQRLFDGTSFLAMLMAGPVALIVSVSYGYYVIGPWALLGNAIFVLFFPIQMAISKLTTALRARLTLVSDKRVKQMNEILTSIKLIKMYAWEQPFSTKLKEQRQEERKRIEHLGYVQSMSSTITPFIPIVATVCTFVGHTMTGNDLTATQAFTVVNLFVILRNSITIVPSCVRNFAEARVSCFRLKNFLLTDKRTVAPKPTLMGNTAIQIQDASFTWGETNKKQNGKTQNKKTGAKEEKANGHNKKNELHQKKNNANDNVVQNKPVLTDINVDFGRGELVAVCGPVGSGKSSLLCALMGQLKMLTEFGEVKVCGDIAYASQSPWIFNASVKENILFGSTCDETWYNEVVYACSLVDDFKMLPNGDETEIGERGSNLSGGQKQRVNLARAVYSRRDVVLLDDPLSAVDVHVGEHIFQHCIQTLLKDKTVVLVTHQLQYLDKCSTILYMEDGQILEQGSHQSLMNADGTYSAMMTRWRPSDNKTADDTKKKKVPTATLR